ncbi:sce7726 family protein [Shinella sp.]|uniref:sce7726 family protein n=1 Tax=Shinella sp. TaxID=1870904 RepID=UPI003F723D15
MRDMDVRYALRDYLGELHSRDHDTLVVEEMGIWAGAVRIDIAVINGEMHGFELKSERDTLERLPSQRTLYDKVFDRVTLVVADRHYEKALPLIPDWWGLKSAVMCGEGVHLRDVRAALFNPSIDPMQVARLLWKEEAFSCLERHGGSKGLKSATSERLAAELAERLVIPILRAEVRAALKKREHWLRQTLRDKGEMSVRVDFDPLASPARGCAPSDR